MIELSELESLRKYNNVVSLWSMCKSSVPASSGVAPYTREVHQRSATTSGLGLGLASLSDVQPL
jgi:hypothetical protein